MRTSGAFRRRFAPSLKEVRRTVQKAVPGGGERISYRMPAMFREGVVVYYAAFKGHIGLYPPVADPEVMRQVARYAGPKWNLQFPFAEPIPYDLITKVAAARLQANLAKAAATKPTKPPRS